MEKINWGWRIAFLYVGFVCFMGFLVWKTTTVHDSLVDPNYYAKELKFQEQLDKANRANGLQQKLRWDVSVRKVTLYFPEETKQKKVQAEVLFYKASDEKKDFRLSCAPDSSGSCSLESKKMEKGTYQLEVNWQADSITYFSEGTIVIL